MKSLESCPACGSIALKVDYRAGEWRVWKCENCTHGFLNPQLDWVELGPYYREDYAAYNSTGGILDDDQTVLETARNTGELCHIPIRQGQRLLDVGCGGGRFLRLARQLGINAMGIEPSPIAVACARSAGLDVFAGTLEDYISSQTDRKFDVVTLNHVLEHVPSPVDTLRLISQILAPNGRVCIIVPNAACGAARRLRGRWHSADLPRHLMQFTPKSLDACSRKAGFRQVYFRTFSLPKATASSIRIWLRHRCWIPGSISGRVRQIDTWIAPRLSARLDKQQNGEALIMFFELAASDPEVHE